MFHDIDETIKALVLRDVAQSDVEVVFDAPTKEWATRRNKSTINVYLYDIREDLRRRQLGVIDVRDSEGHTTSRRQPARFFKLSYLMTVWTGRPADEHRLLAGLLQCFLRHDHLPEELLVGELAEQDVPFALTLAIPPPEDRALSDVWSAMGGELKPSLDLVVIVPWDLDRTTPTGTPVSTPHFDFTGPDGAQERRAPRGEPLLAASGPTVRRTTRRREGRGKPTS